MTAATTPSPRAILHQSESHDWYTPSRYVEAARAVLGGIDLDPASCAEANEIVQATRYYTATDDGLAQPWHGRVFLNPPYGTTRGRSNQDLWSKRLIDAFEAGTVDAAVLLVNAATGNQWFQRLWKYPICFAGRRIRFWRPDQAASSPTHSNALVYFGADVDRFIREFSPLGAVVAQLRPDPEVAS
ncbi:MAG TPA: DNA N-6-adenine-methyltransferase [Herpetosiphonaceae bacterium]|nr:DNA N-6-adenine-methyltransferase [Herpetosiphonaceae bacterium]